MRKKRFLKPKIIRQKIKLFFKKKNIINIEDLFAAEYY